MFNSSGLVVQFLRSFVLRGQSPENEINMLKRLKLLCIWTILWKRPDLQGYPSFLGSLVHTVWRPAMDYVFYLVVSKLWAWCTGALQQEGTTLDCTRRRGGVWTHCVSKAMGACLLFLSTSPCFLAALSAFLSSLSNQITTPLTSAHPVSPSSSLLICIYT